MSFYIVRRVFDIDNVTKIKAHGHAIAAVLGAEKLGYRTREGGRPRVSFPEHEHPNWFTVYGIGRKSGAHLLVGVFIIQEV